MNRQVAEAFKKLFHGKRTGVLACEADSARRAVYFQSGFVVSATSSLEEDRLGEVMIRHGRITQQQFEDASHFIKSGWKLGEILTELGIIGEEEIEHFVRLQLLDIACTQVIRPPKRLAFSPLSGVDVVVEAPLSVADILMEAARRTPRIEQRVESLKADERKLGFPRDPLRRFQDINLKPEEGFVLSRIDGNQTTKDIFAVSPLSEEQTARALLGLLEAGLIEPEGDDVVEPKETRNEESESVETNRTLDESKLDRERASVERLYEEVQLQDHWQVLGLEKGASSEEVKQSFFRGAKKFHPDRFRRIPDPEFQEKLSFIFRRINEAYETLSSQESKERYETLRDREDQYDRELRRGSTPAPGDGGDRASSADATALFHRAQRAHEEGDYWGCIELARQAVDLAPDCAAYYHLLGLALAQNPKWRQDAEKNFKIASNLDPFKATYLLELAKLYERAGLHLRAQRTFEKARAIDPSLDVAQ